MSARTVHLQSRLRKEPVCGADSTKLTTDVSRVTCANCLNRSGR